MNKCSFCGKPESQVQLLITGLHGYICNECVQRCEELLQEVGMDKASASGKGNHKYNLKEVPKPTEIKAYLTNTSLVRTTPSVTSPCRCITTTSV